MIDKFRGKYDFLSNFYPVLITIDEIPYPSAEHAFQAMKTLDRQTRLTFYKDKPVLEGKILVPFCLKTPNTAVYRRFSASRIL